MKKVRTAIAAAILATVSTGAIAAQPYTPKDKIADSIIVKMKDMTAHKKGLSAVQDRLSTSATKKVLGKTLQVTEQLNRNFWVVNVAGNPTDSEIMAIIAELKKGDYGVLTAEPNYYVYPMATVYNDTGWDSVQKPRLNQGAASGFNNGIAQFVETQRTAGTNKIVSIVDTGKLPHVEVSSTIANEVNFAPNATAQTKGDSTAGLGSGCDLENDTEIHHGLNMASLSVGLRNNNTGLVGYSGAQSYAVRSLSECDGSGTSVEVIRGILWSAGLDMDEGQNFVANGYPRNDTPATVINLSLGATPLPNQDLCPTGGALHTAVQRAIAAGSVVVAAAGNEYGFVYTSAPFTGQRVGQKLSNVASCEGVVSVGATDFNGNHAEYANIPGEGERLVTSVPVGSGNGVSDSTLQATINDNYNFGVGTSQATAIMSGLLASLLDVIGNNRPSNAVLLDTIASTGSSFPESDSVCAPSIRDCGTRLDMIALTQALDSTVDLETLFKAEFPASMLNLTDIAEIVSFQDSEGSSEGVTITIINDGQAFEIKSTRSGSFTLKAGSSKYADRSDRTELATAEVMISEFGDISVSLADIKRTEAAANEIIENASRIVSIREGSFQPVAGTNSPVVTDAFEIVDGKIIWNFDGSLNGTYEFFLTYEEAQASTTGRSTQAVEKSETIQMVVASGVPTTYTTRTAPGEVTPGNPSGPVTVGGGGGGGGGSLSLFGLLALALLMVTSKFNETKGLRKAARQA